MGSINQDNFFTVMDGDVKIMAIFDGHGENGQHISNFAMCEMLNYIKNAQIIKGKTFIQAIDSISDEEVTKVIKCAFKYTQDKLRDWYEEHGIDDNDEEEIEIDVVDREFIDNISWDTNSQ